MYASTSVFAAPYADTVIPLYFSSITGLKHRTICCAECGQPIIERDSDTVYRLNDASQPASVSISSSPVHVLCGNCRQRYELTVSIGVVYGGRPLHVQTQSIWLSTTPVKYMRYLYCLECGAKFLGLADRIQAVSDNVPASEHISAGRFGPMEALCSRKRCHQSWALMV